MMDAFHSLGLERSLLLEDEQITEAFVNTGKQAHPDAGGRVEDFEKLEQSARLLRAPGERLKHWLELEGIEGHLRGSVSGDLMGMFSELGELLQRADALIRERSAAGSALAKALLEGRTQEVRDDLERVGGELEAMVSARVAGFPEVEAMERDGWELARELIFLAKWQGQVRQRFGQLW
ncbi:MAG: hypothetical protein ACQKBU_05310 [Verrucomicrobiales bacterium]